MDSSQKTVSRAVAFEGVGLHSGKVTHLEIHPAKADTGIVFLRTDSADAQPVRAHISQVSATDLSTKIGRGLSAVSTIEHLMAALAGLGIDNALIKIDGPEVPILDGSAWPFVEKLLEVGSLRLAAQRRFFVVKEAFEVRHGDRFMRVEPSNLLQFSCSIEFSAEVIGKQSIDMTFSRAAFLQLCDARTFCHVNEVAAMRQAGLALGGSLENAIVVSDTGIMNTEGLRGHDEFVRHKLLDCIGDLALLGAPLVGRVSLHKAGHAMHAMFAAQFLSSKAYYIETIDKTAAIWERDEAMSAQPAAIFG